MGQGPLENDSTVTVTLRAWTDPHGYIDTCFDLIKAVKQAFDREGLTFAYPHQVAVETRPWKPPAKARQRESQRKIEREAPDEVAPPTDGEWLGLNDRPMKQRGKPRSVTADAGAKNGR